MFYIIVYLLCVILSFIIILYIYITYNFDYWEKRNVPFCKPRFPFGTFECVIMGRKSLRDLAMEQYRRFEGERFFGVFDFGTPILMIKDPGLIEKILITDFQVFCNKKLGTNVIHDDFLSYALVGMKDEVWRSLRMKLNPAFSTNKVKQVFDSISQSADELLNKIQEHQLMNEEVSAISLSYLYSNKVTSSTFFGFECNSLASDLFTKMLKKTLLGINIIDFIFLSSFYVPKLVNLLYYIPSVKKVLKFYKDISAAAIQTRKEAKGKRNDVLQVLLDLKNEKDLKCDHEDFSSTQKRKDSDSSMNYQYFDDCPKDDTGLSDKFIMAQMFSFIGIGVNTLTTSLSVLLVDIASKPTIQSKVQAELDEIIKKYKQINMNSLQHLKYLDAVIQESLRMNPGFIGPVRSCSSPYPVPGSDLVLERGTTMLIPTYAIHMDPSFYPDPEVFIPERFIDNNFKTSNTYLPFGAGPRICLVFRLVILMLKVAVVKVLLRFSLQMSPRARLPLRYRPTFMDKLEDHLWLTFEPRTLRPFD